MYNIKWNIKSSLLEPNRINEFSSRFSIPYEFATVILNRGIETEEKFLKYIKKPLDLIYNPKLMPDMENAVERIVAAIENKEKICIYGDYDVDGVTSTALLYSFLKENGAFVEYYIPDRITEGYGLNIKAINKLSKSGIKLLITVDCGIASIGEVEFAKVMKMDVIITDHHTCQQKLPNALAVINPKRLDSEYPYNQLAGVGVAFKLVLALGLKLGKTSRECFDKYVAFAAIGTVADVVELQNENRVIVDKGLKMLENCDNVGIKALLEIAGVLGKPVNSTTVAFMLSPRLNASGRMDNARLSVELLLSEDKDEAYRLSLKLDEMNRLRQQTEKAIFEEALEMIKSDADFQKKKIIVLAKEGWHHGVIGIVASKITEMFTKPCILITVEGGKGKGSGRSIDNINLFESLLYCEELLTQFGGHKLAAGLSLNMSEFDEFVTKINKYIVDSYKEDPVRTLDVDCTVNSSFLTVNNARQLSWFEPYGMNNEKPVFAMSGVKVIEAKTMGQDSKHLKVLIEASGKTFDAVGFSMGDAAKLLTHGRLIDIAFNLEVNNFMGNEKVQLLLKDIKSSNLS